MTVDTLELQRKSVTRDDHQGTAGDPWHIIVAPMGPLTTAPGLPAWPSKARDAVLTSTLDMEDMWASAVYKTITKRTARGWEVQDSKEGTTRTKRYQQILLRFDGKRYVPGMSKVLQDFLLTDNGAFVEVVRASRASGSRILGLMHLDSFRCTRTGDAAIPVIYRDTRGYEHEMKDYQILDFVDQPSPRASANGIGRCAGTRGFRTIIKLASVEIYFREKVTGDRNLAIHIVNGISPDQLEGALSTAREDRIRRGYVMYKGSVVIPAIKADQNLSVVTIPLAEVPDGFEVETERRDAYLRFANALGVPVQDIQPLSGQGLGTGTQTIILSEEAEGLGLAAFDRDWTHAINDFVFPETTTFTWTNPHDTRDQKAQAEVNKLKADVVKTMTGDATNPGPVTNEQGLNLLVDWNVVPRAFLPAEGDQTPGGALSDEEKPVSEEERAIAAPVVPVPVAEKAAETELGAKLLALRTADRHLTAEEVEAEIKEWRGGGGKALEDMLLDLYVSGVTPEQWESAVERVKAMATSSLIDSEWEQAMEWAKKVMEGSE